MFMKTALIINALLKNELWMKSIAGIEPVGELIKKALKVIPKEDIYFLIYAKTNNALNDYLKGFHLIKIENNTTKSIFELLFKVLNKYDEAVYLFIDNPLIDVDITKAMLSLHHNEFAEYTYGEGFPKGIAPEIININILPKLASLLINDNSKIGKDSVFNVLSKDINSFDIETYFSKEDLKLKRIELTTSVKRNSLFVKRIIENIGISFSYDELKKLIKNNPIILRTLPSYIEIEITNRTNGVCSYSPLPLIKRDRVDMSYENYKHILNEIKDFSEDFYVSLSFLGEPLIHKDIKKIIEYTIDQKDIKLILETDGLLFDPDFSHYISDIDSNNLHIIFDVDAVKKETYKKLRGGDLDKVERNIRYILSKKKKNIFVQMVRIDENEDEMIEFYDMWEKEGANVIIQKYNSYCNQLSNLSKDDLRPLERIPCWHLARDFVVFNNGDVPRCKQDINGEFCLGNLIKDPIENIWEKGNLYFLNDYKKNYDKYCLVCDEYFTFNF